jgi:WD40 repeat protein
MARIAPRCRHGRAHDVGGFPADSGIIERGTSLALRCEPHLSPSIVGLRSGSPSRAARCAALALAAVVLTLDGRRQCHAADEGVSFHRDIAPLLRARCQGCHQPARLEGGVDLTTAAGLLGAGDSGQPIVVPGDPDGSELLAQVTPDADGVAMMPQKGEALTADERELLRRWIAEGAKIDSGGVRPEFDQVHPPEYSRPATISALDVSPDGKLLAVSGINETLLLDARAAARGVRVIVRRLIGQAERIESLRFSPDGARLAVAGGLPGVFGELQIWNATTGELQVSHAVTGDVLRGVAWAPDGSRVAFGGADTNLYVVDAATGEQALEQGAHADWVLASAFSADGQFVVSGSRDQTLKLIETRDGRFVDNITAVSPGVPGGMIYSLVRHPQLDMVAVGGSEGVPRTYLIHRQVERKIGDDSNLVREYPPLPGRIFSVAISPDGKRLAAASSDGDRGRVDVFAVPEAIQAPEDVRLIQGKVSTERTAEETARLAAYHRTGAVRLASASGGMGPAYALAFLPDGKQLVVGGGDGVLRFVDAKHGTIANAVMPFPASGKFASAPAPSPSAERAGERGQAGTRIVNSPRAPLRQGEGSGEEANEPTPVEFLTDVMPILAKVGCNAGTCHGAREGKNGFALSLRGYDPEADYRALTDDFAARRVNRALPDASLMLLKPSGGVPHGGGVVLEPGSRRYEIVRRWIEEGAQFHRDAARVVAIDVTPLNPVVQSPGETVAVRVAARYSDGSRRDVTEDAFIESGETEVATADAGGTVTAVRRGEAPILARYEGAYAATTLTVMGDRRGFESSAPPVYNRIDALVDAKLARMKIAASPLCTDEEFLRRVTLHLTGLPPTADDVRAFAANARPSREKRQAVVERLIGGDDYIEHWTNRWADLLLVNGKFLGAEGAAAYRGWIRTAVAENWPYDRFVRELFTASGSNREHPAASYFKALRTPEMIGETTTQVFLGVRFNCNKCHDHPFERWTVNDYYGWAAYFKDVHLKADPASGDRKIEGSAVESAQPLFEIVSDRSGGEVRHVRTGLPTAPRLPYPAGDSASDGATLRHQAAAWLTSPANRYFASSFVNRVWAHLTGVGLIEPIDDIRAGNPPTNPELLDWLTAEFIAHDFDVQWLIRTICESRTYQLSSATNPWNEDDQRNYSHALPRRLPAEVLYDAVHRAVGATTHLPGVPAGTRAAALPDAMLELESGLLSKLGRPARESGCECERTSDLQLGPVMALVNGPTFAAAIDDPDSELAKLTAATTDDRALVTEVYLRILNRPPTEREIDEGAAILASPDDDRPEIAAALARRVAELDPGFEAWRRANRPIAWTPLALREATGSMDAAFEVLDDGSILATRASGKGSFRIVADAPLSTLRGLRLEVLADERLPGRGPGRAGNGNFVLSQLRVSESSPDFPRDVRRLKFRTAEAGFNQSGYDVGGAIDARPETGWAVDGATGQNHTAAFTLSRPIKCDENSQLVIELDHQYDAEHLLGRFRLSVTADEPPLLRPEAPAELRPLLAAAPGALSPADINRLRAHYWSLDAKYVELKRAEELLANPRLSAVQDLAWALINSPAFLFNH